MESAAYDVLNENPGGRPKKHASAADRQAAYRARGVTIEFRADPQTASTLDSIAATLDVSRAELLLSMTKFALTNHDWARFGLTHKTIPRYQGNPMATRASPAQIAARKRFAQMAKSGALAKKRKAASKKPVARKAATNPAVKRRAAPRAAPRPFYYIVKVGSHYDGQFSSAHYTLADVQKIAQAKADKYGVQARITELHS